MKIKLKGYNVAETPSTSRAAAPAANGIKRGAANGGNNKEEGEDEDASGSSAGGDGGEGEEEDDDFVNAPISLPESSGDEYTEGRSFRRGGGQASGATAAGGGASSGRRRRRKDSGSPRPRARRDSNRLSRAGTSDFDAQGGEEGSSSAAAAAPPTKRRGRPPGSKNKPKHPVDKDGSFSVRLWQGSRRDKGKARINYSLGNTDADSGDGDEGEDGDEQEDSRVKGDEDDEDEAAAAAAAHDDGDDDDDDDNDDDDDDDDEDASVMGDFTAEIAPRRTRRPGRPRKSGASTASSTAPGEDGAPEKIDRRRRIPRPHFDILNDELQLPTDPAGEAKIDVHGQLLGGREHKATTFKSEFRDDPERLYVLGIDAARCAGFRDSLYFFRKNPYIHKIQCTTEEKEMLAATGRLHVNLKTRQVIMVTAKNCFQVFGARFVKNGKNVIDDYYESAAIAKGLTPGEPAFIESYDVDIDNSTLAMPKRGAFAKKKGAGRPAYMKIGQALEMASAKRGTPEVAPPSAELEPLPVLPKRPLKESSSSAESSSEDDGKGGRRKKKGWRFRKDKRSPFYVLQIPQTYNPTLFGTIGGFAGPQFGGHGLPPFGEQWERSKARKPAPHLNGRNWMIETAKVTRAQNRAYRSLAKAYSAYHTMSLGKNTPQEIDEEKGGMWEVSGDEDEYESVREYKKREGLASGDEGPDGQHLDDRQRGRSPPTRLQASAAASSSDRVKAEEKQEDDGNDAMALDGVDADPAAAASDDKTEPNKTSDSNIVHPDEASQQREKKRRRRRSPLRGFYDMHTRVPYVRTDTQPNEVISFERIGYYPELAFGGALCQDVGKLERLGKAASQQGIVTVEYDMVLPPLPTIASIATE